ncbi:MAG: hypothetical protein GY869_23095 [Planctomycetes bacterium]|nr:hypothetical protein [Planctomycetota bacterium]
MMTLLKIKTYAKLAGICLVVLFIVHFMWSNNQRVTIRLFWRDLVEVYMFYVIIGSASSGAIILLTARKFRKLWGDLSHIRREEKTRQKLTAEIKSEVVNEQNKKSSVTGKET